MPRAVSGVVRKRRVKKILNAVKGQYGARSKQTRSAKNAYMRSLAYAYRDRRQKKRVFRNLWIIRINAAVRPYGISYSKFINGLRKANILINRKMLSNLAINDPNAFGKVVETAKRALA